MSGVSVLMYHAIESFVAPAVAKDAGEYCYVLKLERFREQLEYLHTEGFSTFLIEELLDMKAWPEKSVILTFDDGHESNFTLALPMLQQFGFKAVFFITTDWIDTPHYMTTEQIKSLHNAGMGIGSHGLSHKFLDDMNDNEIMRELHDSMEKLAQVTGGNILSFSAPGGRSRHSVAAIAEGIGYRFLYTSQPGILNPESSLLSIPRIAVRTDTDIKTFKRMVCGDVDYMVKLSRRNSFLSFAKKILGNKGYEQIRKILLEIK